MPVTTFSSFFWLFSRSNLALESSNQSKNMILFTAAHHAREALSLSMIFNIFLINLKSLIHQTPRSTNSKKHEYLKDVAEEFWGFNNLLFLPVVNLDAVLEIDNGFH